MNHQVAKMKKQKRVSLYDRLPEIYREKDAGVLDEKGQPLYPLKAYLEIFEDIFSAIHANIESLYHDLFIETCAEWVIPYIGDLLGVSHLRGTPWTRRADVAQTTALRRRKGTLGAMEQLAYILTNWAVHCVELRKKMLLNQNINYYKDFVLEKEVLSHSAIMRENPLSNGPVSIRDPAFLSLLGTAFDPFAHTADFKPLEISNIRYNIPNLAIFLWRLEDYQIGLSKPLLCREVGPTENGDPFLLGFSVHPLGRPLRLFNRFRRNPDKFQVAPLDGTNGETGENRQYGSSFQLTQLDETPGPILTARLMEKSRAGNPAKYVAICTYDTLDNLKKTIDEAVSKEKPWDDEVGLRIHIEKGFFPEWPANQDKDDNWVIRGEDLSCWENGLGRPLRKHEVAIDPINGRILFAIAPANATDLIRTLRLSFTYGAVGDVGAHPIPRDIPIEWQKEDVYRLAISGGEQELEDALTDIKEKKTRVMITIEDSLIYELTSSALELRNSLFIRAASYQRPIIRLANSLEFRPITINTIDSETSPAEEQSAGAKYTELAKRLRVRLEGLFLTRGESSATESPASSPIPLIKGVAINRLEIIHCTLDPGGFLDIISKETKLQEISSFETAINRVTIDYRTREPAPPRKIIKIPILHRERVRKGTNPKPERKPELEPEKGRKRKATRKRDSKSKLRVERELMREVEKINDVRTFLKIDKAKLQKFMQDADAQAVQEVKEQAALLLGMPYRTSIFPSMKLDDTHGLPPNSEEKVYFEEIPEIVLENVISGPQLIDRNYSLELKNSIIDAGKGVGDPPENSFAITGVGIPDQVWGPPTQVAGVTIFGQVRVEWINGTGAIFVHPLAVQDILKGCLNYSYISGNTTEIPQREDCILADEATPRLNFVSEIFGQPAFGQLAHNIDYRIRERGPKDNAMGAFNYLLATDKWRNLNIRFREFMPVGIRPILITVT